MRSIVLSDGTQVTLPVMMYDSPTVAIGTHTFTNEPLYHYKEGEPLLYCGTLAYFADQLIEKGETFPTAMSVYYACMDLRDAHSPDYYASGQGYSYITQFNQKGVWVIGSIDTGGLLMIRLASGKFAFISFFGIYKHDTLESYRYGFTATCSQYEGQDRGVYSYNEISNAAMCLYKDYNWDEPPIYMCYQPDGYYVGYIDSWVWTVGEENSVWNKTGDIRTAVTFNNTFVSDFPATNNVPVSGFLLSNGTNLLHINDEDLIKLIGGTGAIFTDYSKIAGSLYGDSVIDDDANPYSNSGFNTAGGGKGGFSDQSDQGGQTEDDQFTIDALNSGFFTLYNPTKGEVKSFNNFLFTGITDSIEAQLKKLIANPIDFVVFMAMCHFKPVSSNSGAITYCGINTGVSALMIDKQMHHINCGTVYVNEDNQTKSFLSYNPYFKSHLFIPYVGEVEINTDDIMGSYVTIDYWIDLLTGSCVVQVTAKRPKRSVGDTNNAEGIVIGEYTGNCYLNLPMSATDWRGLYQSVVQFAGSLTAAAGGNPGALAGIANSVISEKVAPSRSGQLGANYGYVGYQKPYFLFERPIPSIPYDPYNKAGWGSYVGYPSNMIGALTQFSGYTEVEDDGIWANGISGITDEEATMVREVFSKGVYLNW